MSIKTMSVQSRPREHAAAVGIENVSDIELLAIIIATGSRNHSALSLAADIIEKTGSLYGLSRLSLASLKLKGLGRVKKMNILAAVELGKRAVRQKGGPRILLKTADSVYQFCCPQYLGLLKERISIILLDKNFRYVYEDSNNRGEMDNISLSISWILKACALNIAPYIILIHNHPSNILLPSAADDVTTYSIRESLKLLKIQLLDHLIVSDEGYFSYRENGRLKKLTGIIEKSGDLNC